MRRRRRWTRPLDRSVSLPPYPKRWRRCPRVPASYVRPGWSLLPSRRRLSVRPAVRRTHLHRRHRPFELPAERTRRPLALLCHQPYCWIGRSATMISSPGRPSRPRPSAPRTASAADSAAGQDNNNTTPLSPGVELERIRRTTAYPAYTLHCPRAVRPDRPGYRRICRCSRRCPRSSAGSSCSQDTFGCPGSTHVPRPGWRT
mmetsp:Transcript_20370/g.48969  ORF Transcript_20370/g.48969 Transcript_20370/m.48969 type:complete len:202 (-) Transcript_20370:1383-1988(-)